MADFAPGDVVWLKSGGPAMTVVSVRDSTVWVVWFCSITGNKFDHSFAAELLTKVKPK